jgi:hypothetical protein
MFSHERGDLGHTNGRALFIYTFRMIFTINNNYFLYIMHQLALKMKLVLSVGHEINFYPYVLKISF